MMNNRIKIIKGDITTMEVDAIVNAANVHLVPGGGVDGAIHRAAGKQEIASQTKAYVEQHGILKTGEAMMTTAGRLKAKQIIHTAGPVYVPGNDEINSQLKDCYINAIKLAVLNDLKTIAFPCISTGIYGYPKEEAAKVAIENLNELLEKYKSIEEVDIVCFDSENFDIYESMR